MCEINTYRRNDKLTAPSVLESCVMVLLKERYLKSLIQATNTLMADSHESVRALRTLIRSVEALAID